MTTPKYGTGFDPELIRRMSGLLPLKKPKPELEDEVAATTVPKEDRPDPEVTRQRSGLLPLKKPREERAATTVPKEDRPDLEVARQWWFIPPKKPKEERAATTTIEELEKQQETQLEELGKGIIFKDEATGGEITYDEYLTEISAKLKTITDEFAGEEWLGRREITQLRANETILKEELARIEKIKAEATAQVMTAFTAQKELLRTQTEFSETFSKEGVDVALGIIPEYRTALESYRALLQERRGEEETEPSEAEVEIGEVLTELAAMEAEPEKYRTPEEQQRIYNQMSYWDKVKAMFNVSPGYVKWSPLALVTLAAPHQEKLEWWHETVDVTYSSLLWQAGQAVTVGAKAIIPGVSPSKAEGEAIEHPFWTAEGKQVMKEQTSWFYQTATQILNPLYWLGPGIVIGGVRAAAVTPAALRALPEATQLFRYTAMAAKYPALAPRVANIGRLAIPLTEIAARAMTPAAMAARATLFGGGVIQKVAAAGVRAGVFPLVKPAGYAAATFAKRLNLAQLNKVATTRGLRITPEAQGFRITGKGVNILARDPMEVASFMDSGTMLPRTIEAWSEKIHIPEIKLGEIPGKPELAGLGWTGNKGEFVTLLGGKIEEVAGKAVYSLEGFPELTVVSESALRGVKPQWLTKELAQSASKGFEMVYQEQAALRTAWSNFELPSTAEIIGQRFQQDRWRNLGQFISKTPGAKTIMKKINTSALEGDLAKQAAISYVDDLERVAAYKNYLMQHLHIYGDSRKLFGIKQRNIKVEHNGEMITIKEPYVTKVGVKGDASTSLGDVLEALPDAPGSPYIFTEQQSAFIRSVHWIEDQTLAFAKREQIKLGGGEPWVKELKMSEGLHYVHRTTHKAGKGNSLVWVGGRKIGSKQSIQQSRYYETMLEGSNSGVQYGLNAEEYVSSFIDCVGRIVADQRLANVVRPMGKTISELVDARFPGLKEAMVEVNNLQRFLGGGRVEFTQEGLKVIRTVPGAKALVARIRRGEKPPEQTLTAIETRFPEIGANFRKVIELSGKERESLLKKITKDVNTEIARIDIQRRAAGLQYKAAKEAVKRTPDVAWLDHPAFAGRLFPEDIVTSLQAAMKPQTSEWLRQVSNISGALRMMTAALDVSAPFIQGLPVLGYDPALWGRATWRHLRTFVDPKVHTRYLLKHEAEIADFSLKHGGFMGGSEWFESMQQMQGLIRKGSGLFGWEGNAPTWVLRQTYGRAEAAWGAFGDVSRLELWGALKPLARNPQDAYNIAQMINKMTGVSSSRGLGLSATQRALESAFVFFAPRYTRAGFALIGDFFKGGITGKVARTSLTRLMTGGLAMYTGICYALGQKPSLDPRYSTFMSIQIGDHRVGIGGFMTSFVRFAANLTYTAAESPGELFSKSRRDNPFLTFLYGKTSPVTSLTIDMITQKDFLGEPIEGVGDYARFLAEQVTPFALQGMIQSWAEMGAQPDLGAAFFAEVWGLRTRPLMLSEQVMAMKDDLAPFVTDITDAQRLIANKRALAWDDLNELQKSQLVNDNPDLDALIKEYEAQRTKRGDADMKLFAEWEANGNRIDEWRKSEWENSILEYETNMILKKKLQQQKDEGVITMSEEDIKKAQRAGLNFRDRLKTISAVAWEQRKALEKTPRFETVYEMLDEWKLEPKDNQPLQDAAYDAYVNLIYDTAGLEDEFGNPLWTEIRRREDEFVQTWGPVNYEYVQARLADSRDEPQILRELRKAKDVLRPYWEIEDELLASGKYPRDTEEQHQWILNAMVAEGPNGEKAATYYDWMVGIMVTDRAKYDEVRNLPYIKAVYQFAATVTTPTVTSAVGTERLAWRRRNPKGDAYLQLFYDNLPLKEEELL